MEVEPFTACIVREDDTEYLRLSKGGWFQAFGCSYEQVNDDEALETRFRIEIEKVASLTGDYDLFLI